MPLTCLAAAFRGLGPVARAELRDVLGADTGRSAVFPTRNFDLVRFSHAGPAGDMAKLGTVEDLYLLLDELALTGAHADLKILRDRMLGSRRILPGLDVLGQYRIATGKRPARKHGASFRVLCQAEDAPWRRYRRVDMQEVAVKAVKLKFRDWKLVEDDADVEIWIQQSGRRAFVSIRLSEIAMRQRDYKIVSLPASLRPTIARAMALQSRMNDDDVVLDPMCGAGTILIERALAGRCRMLLGGDISQEAVEAARANFGRRHKPWELAVWNAASLPLPAASVDKVITNPPWGRQIGSKADNVPLYAGFLRESVRVLRAGGIVVLITSEWDLLRTVLARTPGLAVVKTVKNVSVLGWHADIVTLEKRPGPAPETT